MAADQNELKFLASTGPGFWLCSSVSEHCDQTIATFMEHARFYPGLLPHDFKNVLEHSIHHRRDELSVKALADFFESLSLDILEQTRPDCPFAKHFIKIRRETKPIDCLCWLIFQPSDPLHTFSGALEIIASDYEFFYNGLEGVNGSPDNPDADPSAWGLSDGDKEEFLLTSHAWCKATLDAFEIALGLPTPLMSKILGSENVFSIGSRPRWAADWQSECLEAEHSDAANALLEKFQISEVTNPAQHMPKAAKMI